ncbi:MULTISPECIES: riboflavin synthase [Carboxydocella]|uniref:Riboflavin synthase n=2 Tax=Carboxydocella TaxID=178898 RepID=A0A1T4MUU5_9FIRM|nr:MULTISPECIES: riboflavin synthase [Carboxydocella]AVX20329.1 riboflavin synthase alpha chain [Carboxydocella thermautotrophica]AVX30753.1 riboflavin synthase alpha chain [Carboxydocella thermautotrophica]SJZ70418.1 riboflavin synthase alpha chain [Carboxydocella sporoproducens DSM 16521]GAW30100.1 riboflavin synthase subunit alpha [Carboxydocella sp. ULO1]GAW31158.1 riboflavin synthase subunit alpha [Carboxydocella sp. JDF658]
MFTGIVEELGEVRALNRGARSARIKIAARTVLEGTRLGDSIAVNGTCLTVTELGPDWFMADVMAETLDRTNLGELGPGSRVNLERALTLNTRLGGHLVSGHVDGVGTIIAQERVDIALLTTISAPAGVLRYTIEKGSIAVDGISLTVVSLIDNGFQVSLIPETVKRTTLGFKKVGDRVNLEGDIIGKYIERLLKFPPTSEKRQSQLSMEFLAQHGFLE